TDERSEAALRRVDSDLLAVQITTIHSAKGLEYPIVLVPFGFKQRANVRRPHSYTGPDGQHTLDLASTVDWDAGPTSPGDETTRLNQRARRNWVNVDTEGDELRLLYVALTRAAHRAELWWASTLGARSSALGRILLDRDGGGPVHNSAHSFRLRPPNAAGKSPAGFDEVKPPHQEMSEADVMQQLHRLAEESNGAVDLTVLPARLVASVWTGRDAAPTTSLQAATSPHRATVFDPTGKQWSFSRLTSVTDAALVEHAPWTVFDSSPVLADDRGGGYDEPADPAEETAVAADVVADAFEGPRQLHLGVGPVAALADIAGGTRFGTFVHAVLEDVDASALDLRAAVHALVVEHARRDGLELELAHALDRVVDGLVAALRTPLGPLFSGLSLAEIAPGDRLTELSFDMPLVRLDGTRFAAGAIGDILLQTLPRNDPLRPFAGQLSREMASLDITGWMHGSIDAVVRVPGSHGHYYVVVDYKTNRLHAPDATDPLDAYRPDRLVAAMEHSRYPLQALLYTVAVHRYLRWRLGSGYEPEHHLGGTGYLFLRGMVGPGTPRVGDVPHGVFSWRPPTPTVLAIDCLFATGGWS
ncbi:MAG: 3'-5' exonuclease, partial [Ilumatobacteraceae bacterium]